MIPSWLEPIIAFFVSLLTAILSLFGIQWPTTDSPVDASNTSTNENTRADVLEAAAVPVLDAAAYVDSKDA